MLLAYIDETKSHGHYYMGSLLVAPREAGKISKGLDALMKEIAISHPGIVDPTYEFHGSDMWGGGSFWRKIPEGNRYRQGIYKRAFEVIASVNPQILIQGLNLQRQAERYSYPYPPHETCLKFLLEKTDAHLGTLSVHGLAICDGMNKEEIKTHRANFRNLQDFGTGGNQSRLITQLVDTLHFVDSQASRPVQAIDLIIFLYRRRRLHTSMSTSERREVDDLWRIFSGMIHYERTWPQ